MPKFYIYKITFSDGSTYIGSHIQYKENDKYVCSSRYFQRHSELKIISREILFYLPSLEQMNIMETISIISDKCNSPKNINGNYGNWLYNFHSKLDCPWNKGIKMSQEFKDKISETESEPLICIETMEIIKNTQENGHFAEVARGERFTADGKHYRKISKEEKEKILSGNLEETKKLNKAFMAEKYADVTFYYCQEYNIAFESIGMLAGMLATNPSEIKKHFGQCFFGFTIFPVLGNIIYSNDIKVIRKLKNERKTTKVRNITTGEVFNSVGEAMKKYGGHISSVLNGHRKTAGDCEWERITE